MFDCLSSLTRFTKLQIEDLYTPPRSDQVSGCPHPLTRIILPVLTAIALKGGDEYLDQFFSHFDAPLLKHVDIMFSGSAVLDLSQISQFMGAEGIIRGVD